MMVGELILKTQMPMTMNTVMMGEFFDDEDVEEPRVH